MRIVSWFWRNRNARDLGSCSGCRSPLQACPGCLGEWRARACRSCQLGTVCPVHINKWL